MKKIYGLVLLMAGLMVTAYAQTPEVTEKTDTSYWYNNKAIFEKLDTKHIPSGLLMDYGMTFAEMDRYNGQSLNTDNEISTIIFEQINASLLSAQIAGMRNAPLSSKALYENLHKDAKKNHIRIAGLLYQYQQLDSSKADKITIADGKLYDKYTEGIYQNPYETKNVFAMALSVDRIHGSSFIIETPANLVQSNMDIPIASVRINADDGLANHSDWQQFFGDLYHARP